MHGVQTTMVASARAWLVAALAVFASTLAGCVDSKYDIPDEGGIGVPDIDPVEGKWTWYEMDNCEKPNHRGPFYSEARNVSWEGDHCSWMRAERLVSFSESVRISGQLIGPQMLGVSWVEGGSWEGESLLAAGHSPRQDDVTPVAGRLPPGTYLLNFNAEPGPEGISTFNWTASPAST